MREPLRFLVLSRIAFLEHFAEHVPSDLVVCWTQINSGDVGHPTTDIAIGGCPIGPSDGAGLASGCISMLSNFDRGIMDCGCSRPANRERLVMA